MIYFCLRIFYLDFFPEKQQPREEEKRKKSVLLNQLRTLLSISRKEFKVAWKRLPWIKFLIYIRWEIVIRLQNATTLMFRTDCRDDCNRRNRNSKAPHKFQISFFGRFFQNCAIINPLMFRERSKEITSFYSPVITSTSLFRLPFAFAIFQMNCFIENITHGRVVSTVFFLWTNSRITIFQCGFLPEYTASPSS